MSEKEINLPDYINFAYNRFLMTRVEYLIFTQSEQESKVLRIIEWCIDNERARLYIKAKAKTPPGEEVKIPDIVWVPISHNFFMSQLQGTIQSETTLKDTLISLEKKYLIFEREGGKGPYDPNLFTINKHRMADLTTLLPPTLDQLDMIAIMKQERHVKKVREGQKLTPSKIDPLVVKIREAIIAPLDPQLLPLYSPIIDPLSRSRGGQLLPPKRYIDTTKDDSKESNGDDAIAHHPPTLASVIRQENAAYDNLIVESTLEDIAEQSLLGSYSHKDTTGNGLQACFTPTSECVCMHCHTLYAQSVIDATAGENAPCGHSKLALFDVKPCSDDAPITQDDTSPIRTDSFENENQEIDHGPMDNALHCDLGGSRGTVLNRGDRDHDLPSTLPDPRRTNHAEPDQHSRRPRRAVHADAPDEAPTGQSDAATRVSGDVQATGSEEVVPQQGRAHKKAVGQESKPTGVGKKALDEKKKPTPPEMPGDDAPWNAETIVQIFEAHQGRRYPNGAKRAADRVRDKELASASAMLLMTDIWDSDNIADNHRRLLKIIVQQETRSNNWWLENNGHVMPHQLVEKDRIHQRVDELVRLKQAKTPPPLKSASPVVIPLSPEEEAKKQASIQRAREMKQAYLQKQAEQKAYAAQFAGIGGVQ